MRKTFNKYSAVAVITACLMLTLGAPSAYADGSGMMGGGGLSDDGGGVLGSGNVVGGGGTLGSGSAVDGGGMAGSGNLTAVFTDLLISLLG